MLPEMHLNAPESAIAVKCHQNCNCGDERQEQKSKSGDINNGWHLDFGRWQWHWQWDRLLKWRRHWERWHWHWVWKNKKTGQNWLWVWKQDKIDFEFENGTNLSYKKCPHRQNPTPCLPSWLSRKTVSNMIKKHKMFGFPKMLLMSMIQPPTCVKYV